MRWRNKFLFPLPNKSVCRSSHEKNSFGTEARVSKRSDKRSAMRQAINAIRQTFPDPRLFQNFYRINHIVGVSQFSPTLAKFMYRSALSYGDAARYLHINTTIIWIIQSRGGGPDKSLPREKPKVAKFCVFEPTWRV